MRLMTLADQSLGSVRSSINEFVEVAQTVTDVAARSAQGKAKLSTALEHANDAVAAITASRTGVDGLEGAAASLHVLDDTTAGVTELRDTVAGMLDGGNGGMKINVPGVQTQIEEARGSVMATRDRLRAIEGAEEVAESKVFGEIASETKAKQLPGLEDTRVDDVTSRAAAIGTEIGSMPTLEEVGTDMVAQARSGAYESLVGREAEVDQMLTILQRRRKANPILLGDAGVGKTQLVEGLAVRVAKGDVPESMRDLKLYSLDAATLKAAAGAEQGGMEKLVKTIVEEIKAERDKGKNVALFVDELHTLMGAGDSAQQLKPALARGDIAMIGATTWEEFGKHIAKDGALVRRVAPISVEELGKEQVLDVLRSVQEGLSRHHQTIAYDTAIQEVQRISSRFVKDRKQPDPAIELLDHALSRVSTTWKSGMPAEMQTLANDVGRLKSTIPHLERQAVIGDTRAAGGLVSAQAQLDELAPKLEAMTTQLDAEREVLGTRQALVQKYLGLMDEGTESATAAASELQPQIADANAAVRSLREQYPERLLNDMLDETAVREAASNLYGRTISAGGAEDAKRLLALPDTLAARVIGQREATDLVASAMKRAQSGMKRPNAPAGAFLFTGPTGVGKTETVRAVTEVMTDDVKNMIRIDMGEFSEPHSISRLFGAPPGYVGYDDSPALADLLKNPEAHVLFDEVEKAHPSIFQKLLPLFEEGRATMGDGRTIDASGATLYMTSNLPEDRIRSFFSPEFINRLSATVRFNPLDRANVGQILDDLLLPKTLAQATDNGLAVEITDAAKSRIIDYGFDAEMGARPLQRSLDNHVADPASEMILELRAAGRSMDPGTPQQAVLDVADDGSGFVMRSADGEITVPVAARPASEHGRQVSETASANAEAARPGSSPDTIEWNPGFSGDQGGSAMTPPTPQPLPQAPNGGA